MKRIFFFLTLVLLSVSLLFAGESSLSVPLSSDAYRIIDTAEVRGIIPSQTDVRPYTVTKVRSLLNTVLESEKVTESEKEAVRALLESFDRTYGISSELSVLEKGYIGGTVGENTSVAVGAKVKSTQTVGLKDKAFDSRNKITAYVKGDLFDAFSFYMDFSLSVDKLDHRAFLITDFRHECDGFYMAFFGKDDYTTSPFSKPGVGFQMEPELAATLFDGRLSIRFASVYRDWGPGLNNLSLSSTARNFDAFEFTLEPVSWFSLSVAVGSLGKSYLGFSDAPSLVGDTELHSNVYDNNFSIQRIEVEFFDGFRASIYESVIWRKRFELAYLNPLGVYMFAQNYIGDYDNMLAGLDVTYTWKGVGRFYAALAIDEMNKASLFCARNIFAYQAGVTLDIPYGDFSSLVLQATYVPPFFGTHYTYKSSENPWGSSAMGTSYVNKGYPLSYPLYPDSVEVLASFSTTITSLDLSLEFTVKDQMRSAQYATDTKTGTTLSTLINYHYTVYEEEYAKRKFFSYIWNNTLDVEVEAEKRFDDMPFSLNVGLQCILETKRSYTLDSTIVKEYEAYDFVNEGGDGSVMLTNPGNGTVMGSDWSTKAKFNLSIGFSLYY